MALIKFSSREFEFVQQPSKDFDCPVCLEMLKDPFLTACCGNHFCKTCVDATKKSTDRCPLCNQTLSGIIDKKFQRQINDLKIFCPNRMSGCEWSGELDKLKKHLSAGEADGECKYVVLSCTFNCGEKLYRIHLNDHAKECDLRPFICEYCDYESTYLDIVYNHQLKCPEYPVSCPNSCSAAHLTRSTVDQHRAVCLEETVLCSFSEVGCKEKMKRRALPQHIEANMLQHQLLMCHTLRDLKRCNDTLIETIKDLTKSNQHLKKGNEAMRRAQNTPEYWINGYKLMAKRVEKTHWREYLSSMAVTSTNIPEPESPMIIKWTDYSKKKKEGKSYFYYTKPFITHRNGYIMQLRIFQNGTGSGEGSHISVYCCLMRGKNDETLKWPFRGTVIVTLLNQLQDNQHVSKEIWSSNDAKPAEVVRKPLTTHIRNETGWGNDKFISITEAENFTDSKQYLMNDTLYFKVTAKPM